MFPSATSQASREEHYDLLLSTLTEWVLAKSRLRIHSASMTKVEQHYVMALV